MHDYHDNIESFCSVCVLNTEIGMCIYATHCQVCSVPVESIGKESCLEGLNICDLSHINVSEVHEIAVIALPQGQTVLLQE